MFGSISEIWSAFASQMQQIAATAQAFAVSERMRRDSDGFSISFSPSHHEVAALTRRSPNVAFALFSWFILAVVTGQNRL